MFNPKSESPNSESPTDSLPADPPPPPAPPAPPAAPPAAAVATAAATAPAASAPEHASLATAIQTALPLRNGALLPPQLASDLDDVALCYFLDGNRYLLAGSAVDPMISYALDDIQAAPPGSSIRLVGEAIALSALGSRLRRRDIQRRGHIAYVRCIRLMRAALLNWDASKTVELLLMMMLVVAYEYLEPQDPTRSHMHIDAAIRLAINHVPLHAMTSQQWKIMSLLKLWTAAYLNPISGVLPNIPTPTAPPSPVRGDDLNFALEDIWRRVILLRQSCIQAYALADGVAEKAPRVAQIITDSAELQDSAKAWIGQCRSFNRVYQVHADYDYASQPLPIEEQDVWPGSLTVPKDVATGNDFGRACLVQIFASSMLAQAIKIQLQGQPQDTRDRVAWEVRAHEAHKTQLAAINALCGLIPFMFGVSKDRLPRELSHLRSLPLDGGAALTSGMWLTAVVATKGLSNVQKRWITGRMKKIGDVGVGGSSYYVDLGCEAFGIVPKDYDAALLHTVVDTWQNSGLSRMPVVLQTI